ncbi:MAG: aminotransferase class I and II [Acidobacteria bacterium]|nr:aminotransferase class I and II [Acidobacteriota bacterium]
MAQWRVAPLRTVRVTHYVTPLREGGSLPAIVEADDEGTYVLKFRGAGQGTRALIAELVSGELARALGLPVPDLVFAELHADLARTEPDPEISALIRASHGLNLALDYLPGSITFDPLVDTIDPDLASRIVWFDALVSNMDRTVRNTNLLMWHKRLWLIDHGASLFAHHTPGWASDPARPTAAFPLISKHVLVRKASRLRTIDEDMASRLTADVIEAIVSQIPLQWIDPEGAEPSGVRPEDYARYLSARLAPPRLFVEEAIGVR